ncbi:MAG: transcriptional repressor LexA [Phycisphaerae bacterium]|nr:transcriptional repressor LexA [Phycisphaerae bacterium]
MPTLTPRQRNVLDFILDRRRDGSVPTVREIAEHFGFSSPNAAAQHLKLIEKKGYIRLLKGRARGIVVPPGKTGRNLQRPREQRGLRVPLVGTVAAGRPITAVENLEGYVTLDSDLFSGQNVFALRVRGDSMTGVGIHDGDLAVVRKQPEAEHNQIAVVMVDEEATLKRFLRKGPKIVLHAENPDYADLVLDPKNTNVEIIGKVIGIMRKMG